jgi:hypothetical protein
MNKKILIFVKMESILLSFIEDNFLGYVFYHYNFFVGLYYLGIFIVNINKFHKLIEEQLVNTDLFKYFHVNKPLIEFLKTFDRNNYEIILIGCYHEGLLKILKNYFHFDKILGNKDNENFNFSQLIKTNYCNKVLKKSILITDNLDWFVSYKFGKVVVTGQFIKIFANCFFHNFLQIPIVIVKDFKYYNKFIYKTLYQLLNKKISKYYWILLIIIVPFYELVIIFKLFFLNIFFCMLFIAFIKSIFFSQDNFFKLNFLAILETNNFINMYNIINNFRPASFCNTNDRYFIKYNVLKSFGSLRVGLFLFCFVSFLYLQNRFLLIIQLFFIGGLLKYYFNPLEIFLTNRTFFYVFNALLYSLFV